MTVPVKLDDALNERVQQLARTRRQSPDALLREAVEQYVEREEARESFLNEASQSWAAYQRDGRGVTAAEVRNWLESWGTPDESGPPKCHD